MKQKWEYITVKIEGGGSTAVSDTLNKMGDVGYEAWHLESRPDHVIVFLKRVKSAILAPDISVGRVSNGR